MVDHAERTHARYSPSKMERLALCPGSDALCQGVVDRDSVWSIEGRKAHQVLEAALLNRVQNARAAHVDYSDLCMEELDEEYGGPYKKFYTSVQECIDYVFGILDAHPDALLWIETQVNPPSDVAPGEASGYCDIAIYIPSTRELIVVDFKNGAGVAKAVIGNKQAKQYAAGFLYDTKSPLLRTHCSVCGLPQFDTEHGTTCPNGHGGADSLTYDVDKVTLTIVQPRAFHPDGSPRSYELTPFELYEYLGEMDAIIEACQKSDAPLVPGEEQCQFCPRNTTCPAREAKALQAVNVQFRTVGDVRAPGIPDPATMEAEHVEQAMLVIPLLRQWANSIEKRMFQLMTQGHQSQYFKLVEAQARRRWHGDPEKIASEFMRLTGCDYHDIMKPRLLTITDAEEMIVKKYKERAPRGTKKAAGEDAKRDMAFLTLKDTSGNLTLATMDDDRPPIDRAQTNFAQIGQALQPGDTE